MKVHHDFEQISGIKNPILTIGTFDGVHTGHQKIIDKLNSEAEKQNGESVLFTFYPHPRMVLQPESHGLHLLQTQEEKLDKLRRMGLQHVIVYPFTKSFAETNASEFVRQFLVEKLGVHTIVVGYDHQFGKNREGSLEQLLEMSKTYPFRVIEIPAQEIDEINISSTKIRKALLDGDIETANRYLNEAYLLSGTVVEGQKLGRTIGFPTANMSIADSVKLIPAKGVYAVEVQLEDGRKFNGMMNIGVRPSVSNDLTLSVEVHLLDFDGDLYGTKIAVSLLKRIRDEKRFSGIDELKQQLERDEETVRSFLLLS